MELSRADLDSLLVTYEQTAGSSAYSGAFREQARREAVMIRERLTKGDFQLGDQITLVVEGEEALTGGFTVQSGPALLLPAVGAISLAGILRSELETHLQQELARYIREPRVQARSSIRLMLTGGIGQTGYHVLPTSTVLSDVLMAAGGLSPKAKLEDIRVERGDRVIWHGAALQEAIIQGRTLDQLSIRAGDHIRVPVKGEGGAGEMLRTVATVAGPIALLTGVLLRIF